MKAPGEPLVQPGLLLQRFLVASYAYYVLDESVGVTDEEYDRMARELLVNWGKFEHRHKHLVEVADLEAGSLFQLRDIDYPGVVKGCARQLATQVREQEASGIWG